MNTLELIFWTGIAIIFYSYIGYGIILFVMIKVKRLFVSKNKTVGDYELPTVSFIIPCYNEASIIPDKIKNCKALDYTSDKIEIIFITDGSTDGSEYVVERYEGIKVMHQPQRKGKSAAENRSLKKASGEIIVFSDANTILPTEALKELVKHYADEKIGAVSGEKRILQDAKENAAGAGEGLYWKYESTLKKFDAELYSLVGAAGELFSFRKKLFIELEEDTVLDDFVLSMRLADNGYRVMYEPKAYAMETSSSNTEEELKRKVRICAGAWQAMIRLKSLLNPFKQPLLTFQYVSHRVLRWTLAPLFLLFLFPLNVSLLNSGILYQTLLLAQMVFYSCAFAGWYFENKQVHIKLLFVPYYFMMMNYAAIAGCIRYFKGTQSAAWERSQRKEVSISKAA